MRTLSARITCCDDKTILVAELSSYTRMLHDLVAASSAGALRSDLGAGVSGRREEEEAQEEASDAREAQVGEDQGQAEDALLGV